MGKKPKSRDSEEDWAKEKQQQWAKLEQELLKQYGTEVLEEQGRTMKEWRNVDIGYSPETADEVLHYAVKKTGKSLLEIVRKYQRQDVGEAFDEAARLRHQGKPLEQASEQFIRMLQDIAAQEE